MSSSKTVRRTLVLVVLWFVLLGLVLWFGGTPNHDVRVVATTQHTTTTSTTTTSTTTTTTTTTTVAQTKSGTKRCKALEPLLADYGLPADPFSYIAWRESRCNPDAVNATWDANGVMTWALNKNGTWDTGLLQVNSIHRNLVREVCGKQALRNNMAGLRDLDCQLRVAARLYDGGKGLSHWRMTYKQDD